MCPPDARGGLRPHPRRAISQPMKIEQLQDAHETRPFIPFAIFLADGRKLVVEHPEFMAFSPAADECFVWVPGRGGRHFIDPELVTGIQHFPSANGRSKRKGRSKT